MRAGRTLLVTAMVSALIGLRPAEAFADACPLSPPEPPIPDVGVPLVPSADTELLQDFGAALGRFQGMTPEQFLVQFGPRTDFVRGDANGDRSTNISDAVCTSRTSS